MRGDPRLDAVRGALTYLGDAERRLRAVRSASVGWALGEQVSPHDTYLRFGDRAPDGLGALLHVAPLGWAGALALVLAAPVLLLGQSAEFVIPAAVVGALLGLYARFRVTLRHAAALRRPSEEEIAEIHQALGEASRFMHEAGVAWVGEHASISEQPWLLLPQIQATLTALHDAEVRALASGKG